MGDAITRVQTLEAVLRQRADMARDHRERAEHADDADALARVLAAADVPDGVLAFVRTEVEEFTPHPNDSDEIRVAFVDACKWLAAVAAVRAVAGEVQGE